MAILVFGVAGMHCGSCARAIERAVAQEPDVHAVSVNQPLGLASIDSHVLGDLALGRLFQQCVQSLGYHATEVSPRAWRAERAEQRRRKLIQLGFAVVVGMWIMLLSIPEYADVALSYSALTGIALAQGVLAVLLLFTASRDTWTMAWRGLQVGRFGIDALIASGHAAAIALSVMNLLQGQSGLHFDALAMLCFAQALARYIEAAVAADTAESMLSGASEVVTVRLDNGRELAADELQANTVYTLAEGAEVPVDSLLTSGEVMVDISAHSGESELVICRAKQKILAGSRLAESVLSLSTLVDYGQSQRDQMLHAALIGLTAKVPAQRRLDALALGWGWVLLSALVFLWITGLWAKQNGLQLVYGSLGIVLLGCPCALAMAWILPWASLGSQLPNGVKVQHYGVMARLADIDTIVFDKTATLTEPSSLPGQMPRLLHSLPAYKAARLQNALRYSSHPSVRALPQYAVEVSDLPIAEVEEVAGQGLKLIYKGGAVDLLGRSQWLHAAGVEMNADENLCQGELCFALDGEFVLRLPLSERPRANALQARSALSAQGFKQYLYSGDRRTAVEHFSSFSPTPFVEVRAQMSPDQKKHAVGVLRDGGGRVLMVGDGANDIAAGAAADLSLGFAGSQGDGSHLDIRLESADMLGLLPSLIDMARRTKGISTFLQAVPLSTCAGLLLLAQFTQVSPLVLSATMTLNLIFIAAVSHLNAQRVAAR